MSSFEYASVDIYGAEVYLATNSRQWSALRRRLSFLGTKPQSAGFAHFALWVPKAGISVPVLVVYIDVTKHTANQLVQTCAHEATHAASSLFEHIGHTPTGVDEPISYFVGWLTQWLWEACRPLIKEDDI